MKRGLVLEGGAMRGMYTAGVLDIFIEKGFYFDEIVGVSAGALFGVNLLSKQKGRVIRYNKKYNKDKNYMGLGPLLKTGNIVDIDYAYRRVPFELDVFDDEMYQKSPSAFYAVVTNMETGQAEYPRIKSVFKQMDQLRASGSMPFFSKPVKIQEDLYLDGAVADSIPVDFILNKGCQEIVVILTKPHGYKKDPISPRLTNLFYKKKYPNFAEKIRNRHIMYNQQMEKLMQLEKEGIAKVIRPSSPIQIDRIEKNPEKMEALYQLGLSDGRGFCKELE